MRLSYIINPDADLFVELKKHCGDFVEESRGLPILKNLPSSYNDFHKVKVRKRKSRTEFTETFNEAFDDEFSELRQRAVFANGHLLLSEVNDDLEPFYVFPVNGYKYLYSTEVQNSNQEYQTVFEAIFDALDENVAEETFRDLLKFSYKSTNLYEGIKAGAEIILYSIPYYYAVRQSVFSDYTELLHHVKEK